MRVERWFRTCGKNEAAALVRLALERAAAGEYQAMLLLEVIAGAAEAGQWLGGLERYREKVRLKKEWPGLVYELFQVADGVDHAVTDGWNETFVRLEEIFPPPEKQK
ncbi:MAG: hypothetical protein AAFY88_23630 [Acidobacteriota bacterium]